MSTASNLIQYRSTDPLQNVQHLMESSGPHRLSCMNTERKFEVKIYVKSVRKSQNESNLQNDTDTW